MKSSYGNNIQYHIFGESHSSGIGITISGLPANFTIDFDQIDQQLLLRQGNPTINTTRQEKVEYDILSGIYEGKTTGSSICIVFKNSDTQSKDYSQFLKQNRPGHADYVAAQKFKQANDYRGGGHFSGRITTPLVFLGALITQIINKEYPNFKIISHIKEFQNIKDYDYYSLRKIIIDKMLSNKTINGKDEMTILSNLSSQQQKEFALALIDNVNNNLIKLIKDETFPTFKNTTKEEMLKKAVALKNEGDSAGGQIETIVLNPPPFIGEPFFYSLESVLSSLLYSIPSVKGVTFGYGQHFTNTLGSQVKDEYIYLDNNKAITLYNYNGGINGGITNGDNLVYTTTIKPIASLMKQQHTYSYETKKIESFMITGRHDSTIINRIIPIINAISAIAIYDLFLEQKKYE